MKNFLLGIMFIISISHVNEFLYYRALDNDKNTNVYSNIDNIIKGTYLVDIVTKRCTLDKIRNNITRRDWFGCGKIRSKISNTLFGEYNEK